MSIILLASIDPFGLVGYVFRGPVKKWLRDDREPSWGLRGAVARLTFRLHPLKWR
jgi:hypothetical protein